MRHKHADLIHAWCEGAEIEVRYTSGWEDANPPLWCNQYQYRIKPEEKKPVVRWMWAWEEHKLWCMSDTFMTEGEAKELETESGIRYIKLDWSRTEFAE